MTCLACPQSAERIDWGHPTLNRSEGVLGVRFVCQLKEYPNINLVANFVWEVAHSGKETNPLYASTTMAPAQVTNFTNLVMASTTLNKGEQIIKQPFALE